MWSFLKLMIWGLLWLITWPLITVYRHVAKKPRIDNCFTWAIREWQENDSGYLVIRWCRSSRTGIKWPHFLFLHVEDHSQLRHFMPLTSDQHIKFFPEAFFEGKIQKGDPVDSIEN